MESLAAFIHCRSEEIKFALLLILYEKPHETGAFRVAVLAVEIPQIGDLLGLIKKIPEFRSEKQ